VAVVAQDQYGVTIRDRKLNYDFATALGAPRSGMQDGFYPIISPIAQHAQVNCIKNINFGQNSPSITLRRNRLQHARELLETPLPVDYDWELESPVSLRKHGDNWLESVDTPFLVKCSVTNVIPLFAEILSWNSGTGTSKAPREWLTDLEWRVIRQYAEVAVSGALICKRPAERLSAYERLPNAHAAELSTTYGLVAEQIWTAFTNPAPYRGGETRFTAAAAWLRAADRMRMFEYAQRVHSRGLDVQSYGVGQVVVRYPPSGALNRTLAIAADCGLLAPVSKFAEGRKHAR